MLRTFQMSLTVILLLINALGCFCLKLKACLELQVPLQFLCITKRRFFELALYLCPFCVAASVIFSVYISSWDLD